MSTIERAASVRIGLCPDKNCTAIHFELERADGERFAVMTVAVDDVPMTIQKMQNLAYQIAATRKDE
jgi:hypothetical protein